MCGIAGFLSRKELPETTQEIITSMTNALEHRGPDSHDVKVIPEGNIALGHQRLSIIDLSKNGSQPMTSPCKRYTLVFNGEIYNYKELRETLSNEGESFIGDSDTEVLLLALTNWGIEPTLEKLNGMFAFAFWDNQERNLYLARDRMGIKPLFYGFCGKNFVFGSELKALKKHPDFKNSLNQESIALFMRHNTIPAPWSIYDRVFQIRAGCYLRFSFKRFEITRLKHYWDLSTIANKGLKHTFKSLGTALETLEHHIESSVKLRMQADVPYGAFLSGGVDSSLISALMQKNSTEKINTFTIGFENNQFNEANEAKKIAQHLGTNHHELYCTEKDALDLIPNLQDIYDQPFADSSQIPTYLVSKMAREKVKLCLSGDGGDELFSGYDRYNWGLYTLRWHKSFSPVTRYFMASWLKLLSPTGWDRLARIFFFLPVLQKKRIGEKIHKLATILPTANKHYLYRAMSSHWKYPEEILKVHSEPLTVLTDEESWLPGKDYRKQMQFIDQMLYLPDDLLHKVDRASMANSLEVRVPLMDHKVVETSWRFTNSMNIHRKSGKQPLKRILKKYVPEQLFNRPKMGFGVPVNHWLRGPLKEWASDLISPDRLNKQDMFESQSIQKVWSEHQSGRKNHQEILWGFLMMQDWLDKNS
ncbi:MAG: asparagine synthase (glutamine-hydrolyzing) [Lentisphaeraceae bacterium]|nr:asparagine synthase (glutamine-hydrolyzing) [Lentisphaeraceae bacterium]